MGYACAERTADTNAFIAAYAAIVSEYQAAIHYFHLLWI
jgi:hypothetical protein